MDKIMWTRTRSGLNREVVHLHAQLRDMSRATFPMHSPCHTKSSSSRYSSGYNSSRYSRYSSSSSKRTTVDPHEVGKFSPIADDWWAPQSTQGVGPLHQLNPIRVKYIRQQLEMKQMKAGKEEEEARNQTTTNTKRKKKSRGSECPAALPFQGLRFADVGCGGGILSESLARLGADLVSIDPSPQNILAAKQHALKDEALKAIDYRCMTAEELVAMGETFDVVCSLEVVEHVADVDLFTKSLSALTKPKGSVFISTINRTMLSYLLAIVALERITGLVPNGTHDWNKFLHPHEVSRYLLQAGIQTVNVTGVVGDPIFTGFHLAQCTDVNYILHGEKTTQEEKQ